MSEPIFKDHSLEFEALEKSRFQVAIAGALQKALSKMGHERSYLNNAVFAKGNHRPLRFSYYRDDGAFGVTEQKPEFWSNTRRGLTICKREKQSADFESGIVCVVGNLDSNTVKQWHIGPLPELPSNKWLEARDLLTTIDYGALAKGVNKVVHTEEPFKEVLLKETHDGVISEIVGEQYEVTFETEKGPIKQLYNKAQFQHRGKPLREGDSIRATVEVCRIPRPISAESSTVEEIIPDIAKFAVEGDVTI